MKNSALLLFSVLIIAACSKEKKQGNLQLTGNIKGLNKGTLYLKELRDTILTTIDSIKIEGDSKFETAVDIKEPEMLYLFLDRGQTHSIDNSLSFFAEPGKMNIDTELETFYANAQVSGSKNNTLYEEYKKIKARYTSEELDITKKKLEAFKNKTELDPKEIEKYNSLVKRKYLYTINFAINHKDREIAPFVVLSEIPDANIKYLDTIQKVLTPKVASSKYGKLLAKYISDRRKTDVGQTAAQ
jgi:hypothetical protein